MTFPCKDKVISFRLDQKEIPAALRAEIKQTALKYFDLAYQNIIRTIKMAELQVMAS